MKLVVANNATADGWASRPRSPSLLRSRCQYACLESTDPRKQITRTSSPPPTAIALRIRDRPRSAVWHGHIPDMRYGGSDTAKTNAARTSKRFIIDNNANSSRWKCTPLLLKEEKTLTSECVQQTPRVPHHSSFIIHFLAVPGRLRVFAAVRTVLLRLILLLQNSFAPRHLGMTLFFSLSLTS